MTMLELGAVDLNNSSRISQETFRGRLYHSSLSGTGLPQQKETANRPAPARHSGKKRLVGVNDLLDGLVLADYRFLKSSSNFPAASPVSVGSSCLFKDPYRVPLSPLGVWVCYPGSLR
jgi:hypothetical protein